MRDLRALPKVVLHDHLDGGLRPETVLELARAIDYQDLPGDTPETVVKWFHQGEASSLESYLEAFGHTSGVMQTPAAMHRVAYEAIADHAGEGVIYAEVRFAPSLHTKLGMTRAESITAALAGLAAARNDFGVGTGLIIDALRQDDDSAEVARVAAAFAGQGVVAFDLAGPERGYPASQHAEACDIARSAGLHLTIHAGEGDGVASITDALGVGAERLGHGVRIIEDTVVEGGRVVELGPVATRVVERHIALEVCPTSNVHTGMYRSASTHPVGTLHRAGFAVTLNTDNRLMSGITMTDEYALAVDDQGFDVGDLGAVTVKAAEAAFCSEAERAALVERILAGYS